MDGGEVELLGDEDRPGGWLLLLDRVRQSYVDLEEPTYLEFPYVQVLAEAIGRLPPGPLDAVHIGGGGATLPRWLDATRPGSDQIVFESHAELLRVVQTRLPLPAGSGVQLRLGDGRAGLAERPDRSADVVVVDAFSGGRVPGPLGTAEFFVDVARVLRESGTVLINTTGAKRSLYLRRLLAAVAEPFPEMVVHGENENGVGNLVVVAGRQLLSNSDGPLGPPLALSGAILAAYLDGAEPLTDAAPLRSPTPPDETWRVGGY